MSDITCVLILILTLITVYLGHKYIVMMETRLKEVEHKNLMMSLYMISTGVNDDFVKSCYNTSSVHSAGTETDNSNSTKDEIK